MTKPILDERFADWVDGRLKPAERALLEAEMVRDPALAQAAEDYRRTVQMLRGALAPPVLEGSIADRVLADIEPAAPARPRLTIRPVFASVIAAAALVLAFVIVRAIPPAPPVDVTETAKRDGVGGRDDFFLGGLRSAEPESQPVQEPPPEHETQLAREAKQALRIPDAPQAEQTREGERVEQRDAGAVYRLAKGGVAGSGAEEGDPAERRALASAAEGLRRMQATQTPTPTPTSTSTEGAKGEENVGAVAKASSDEDATTRKRGTPSSRVATDDKAGDESKAGNKAPGAESARVVPGAFEEQAARWTEGLGELALVVEPGATDARASNPLVFFSQLTQMRVAPPPELESKDRAESSGVGDATRLGAQFGFEVREVVALGFGEAERRDALAAEDQFFLGGQTRTQSVPTDRVFVVSGTAAAMRAFARDLQVEVAAHDGRVLVERSLQLARVVEAERTRARRDAGVRPTPAGPATPGPQPPSPQPPSPQPPGAGTAGRGAPGPAAGGPTTPGPTAPGTVAPSTGGVVAGRAAAPAPGGSPERIELHVIVRARPPGGGR